jgi:hypothetical protein
MLNTSKIRAVDFFLNWKSFLVFNILIFVVKIVFSAYNNFNVELFEDWSIARNLATHEMYSWNLKYGSSAYKLPFYPLFLSFFIKCFGLFKAVKFIIITQHIFYFFIPIIIIKIFENFNLKIAGFISAYLFIFSPAYFYYSNILEATNIFILLFAVWLYFYSLFWTQNIVAFQKIMIFSIVTAFVALTQVVAIPIMGGMILLLIFYKKVSLKNIFTVLCVAMLVYSPWVIRNYITFDKIIISKSPVWQNVFLGYIPDYQILPNNHFLTEEEKKVVFKKTAANDEFVSEKIYEKEVSKIVKADKFAPLKKGLNNFISLWFVPKKYFDDNGISILIGRKIYVLFINLLLLISLIYFFKNNKVFFLFCSVLFLGFTFPYLIGHAANVRFKLDFEWIETSIISLFLFLKYLKINKEPNIK